MNPVKNTAVSFTLQEPKCTLSYGCRFKQREHWPIVNQKGATAVRRSCGPLAGFGAVEEVAAFPSIFCLLVTLTCSSCCARRLPTLVELDAVISAIVRCI